jgi:hypothetical protein
MEVHIVRRLFGATAEALLIVTLVFGLLAVPVLAAPKGGRTTAAMTFAPATVSVGDEYVVSGSGFRSDTWVAIGAYYSDTTWWGSAKTDSQGNIQVTFTASSPGNVLHQASEQGRNGSMRIKASGTLSVSAAAP